MDGRPFRADPSAAPSDDGAALDMHGLGAPKIPDMRFRTLFARARAESGRRWWEILWDFAPLQRFPNHLMLIEYFGYRLFEWERLSPEARGRYVGFLGQRALNRRLNRDATPPGLWGDKLLFDALMRGAGLPVPRLQAVVGGPAVADPGAARVAASAQAIAAFLREAARYPLFGKPNRGEQSRGVLSLSAYEPGIDALRLGDGRALAVETAAAAIAEVAALEGYLLQDRLAPHPAIAEVSAGGLNTVRFVTARGRGAAEILYAVWKIAAPGAPTDDGLFPGALKALIDPETGRVTRAQQGAWIDAKILEAHPATGATLVGRTLPDWATARDTVLKAHALVPEFRILGWDLAPTAAGPVLLEGNGDPGHRVYQTASGAGVLTDRFRALIAEIQADQADRRRARRRVKRLRAGAFRKALGRAALHDLFGLGDR
ncbi:MAG: sugar-transfer associated ATP-grasp domain-containing protein [Pseudomonadota bacterium]